MQGLIVLPEDVQIVALSEMPPQVRSQISGEDGDFALTRPRSRVPSKVIDANSASLLRQFRSPKTIVDGLMAFSKEMKAKPSDVLDEAYPLIESCLLARILVEPGADSEKIEPSFAQGDFIGEHVVTRPIQALIDSEVYQVKTPAGRLGALKIATFRGIASMKPLLESEARVLVEVGGKPAPALLETGVLSDGRHYLLTEWFAGDDAQSVAHRLREQGTEEAARDLAEVCGDILSAYADLHEGGVLHGDVHPRNVLVSESGEVRLIDFGIGTSGGSSQAKSARGGVAFYFDPQYAEAIRVSKRAPVASALAEQYSVAALIYSLLCGPHYLDFSYDKDELLRQIVEDKPLSFERHAIHRYPALEPVVMRALSKNPEQRFDTTREFAKAFREAMRMAPQAQAAVPATHESARLLRRVLLTLANPDLSLENSGLASPLASVTYGYAGIAYAAYRIACVTDDSSLLALADSWAERAAGADGEKAFCCPAIQITPDVVGRVSPFHTPSGISAVRAFLANARGDKRTLDSTLYAYLHQTSEPCENPDITLGHASILLGLMLLMESIVGDRPQVFIERGNELRDRILEVCTKEPAIGEPGSIEYLGMAHGWAGLLYALLRWSQILGSAPEEIIRQRLNQLAGQARLTRRGARWPVQTTPGSIALSGWCNGSAGYTHLWTLAHQIYGDARYLELAEKSAIDAWEGSGGGHGLCCGFAGQAYAQLSLYKHTGAPVWLRQARVLAEKAAATGNALLSQNTEGLPFSLYKGDIGVAVLIAELEKPELSAMPFFEAAA